MNGVIKMKEFKKRLTTAEQENVKVCERLDQLTDNHKQLEEMMRQVFEVVEGNQRMLEELVRRN